MEISDNRKPATKNGEKLKGFYKKLKKIKNIEVIIGVFILAIILLIYAYGFNKKETADTENEGYSYLETEEKLEDILSKIEGAGKVQVMITYDGTAKQVTAESTNVTSTTKTDNSGGSSYTSTDTTQTTTPVFSDSDVVVIKELNPEIIGVVIVAEGAADISVRLELLRVAATALDIDQSIITVSAGVF